MVANVDYDRALWLMTDLEVKTALLLEKATLLKLLVARKQQSANE